MLNFRLIGLVYSKRICKVLLRHFDFLFQKFERVVEILYPLESQAGRFCVPFGGKPNRNFEALERYVLTTWVLTGCCFVACFQVNRRRF